MSAKVQIIGAILKLDRPFRIPHIVDTTQIDRNLVRYHITELTNAGYLEKIDKSYLIRDREELLNSLLEATESTETAKMKPTLLLGEDTPKKLNTLAETIVAGKALGLDQVDVVRNSYVHSIDETIKELKNLRKYVNGATKSPASAAKFFKGINPEACWKSWGHYGGELFTTTLNEFLENLEVAKDEVA